MESSEINADATSPTDRGRTRPRSPRDDTPLIMGDRVVSRQSILEKYADVPRVQARSVVSAGTMRRVHSSKKKRGTSAITFSGEDARSSAEALLPPGYVVPATPLTPDVNVREADKKIDAVTFGGELASLPSVADRAEEASVSAVPNPSGEESFNDAVRRSDVSSPPVSVISRASPIPLASRDAVDNLPVAAGMLPDDLPSGNPLRRVETSVARRREVSSVGYSRDSIISPAPTPRFRSGGERVPLAIRRGVQPAPERGHPIRPVDRVVVPEIETVENVDDNAILMEVVSGSPHAREETFPPLREGVEAAAEVAIEDADSEGEDSETDSSSSEIVAPRPNVEVISGSAEPLAMVEEVTRGRVDDVTLPPMAEGQPDLEPRRSRDRRKSRHRSKKDVPRKYRSGIKQAKRMGVYVPENHCFIETQYGSFIVPIYEEMPAEDQRRHRDTFKLRFQLLNETWRRYKITFDLPREDETLVNIHVRFKQAVRYISARSGADMYKVLLVLGWFTLEVAAIKIGLKAAGFTASQLRLYDIYHTSLIEMGELSGFGEGWSPWIKILVVSAVNACFFVFLSTFLGGNSEAIDPVMKLFGQFIVGQNTNITTDNNDLGVPEPSAGGISGMGGLEGMLGGLGGNLDMSSILSGLGTFVTRNMQNGRGSGGSTSSSSSQQGGSSSDPPPAARRRERRRPTFSC